MSAAAPGAVALRPIAAEDHAWVVEELTRHWLSPRIWSIGRCFDADTLPGFLAIVDGERAGLVTLHIDGGQWQCEVVTLSSRLENRGIGGMLLRAAEGVAREAGCARIYLTTTNDNLRAIGFYQKQGWRLARLHRGIVTRARRVKPEIPLVGLNGIEIHDELEFERWLNERAAGG